MLIKAEVTKVETKGDRLEITAQGYGAADAEWRQTSPIMFQCAALERYERSFHIGRKLTIEIIPL